LTARLLHGSLFRDQIYKELLGEIASLAAAGIRPGLAAVLVGNNPASQMYVSSKVAACEKLGLASFQFTPAASVSTGEMLSLILELNSRDDVDGILVQLPLPPQVDAEPILEAVDPAKDVDGFHPVNMGRLLVGRPYLTPCTPAGVMEILRRGGIETSGANAVVLGRSDIVGKPMALLLLHANATVTICHSMTRNLAEFTRRADILVTALGRTAMITPEHVRPGATVIDVGINRVTDASLAARLFANQPDRLRAFQAKGSAVVGDVHPDVVEIAGAMTPVPGGVGPLTIAMLMSNTVRAARLCRAAHREAGVSTGE
jgi:methylenetetrahydrofolate dehydrogenase (NADP+) / methenyltetrahydrofolate cyclohydrolase